MPSTPAISPPMHDALWAGMLFGGMGLVFVLGLVGSAIPTEAAGVATLLGLAAFGLGGGLLFRRLLTHRSPGEAGIARRLEEPMRIEEVPGMMRIAGHYATLVWWESPPRVVLDAGLSSMPTLRGFEIWRAQVGLTIYRSPSTSARWLKRLAFDLFLTCGLGYGWYLLTRPRTVGPVPA